MSLTTAQQKKVFDALLEAYPDRDDLKITLALETGRMYADLTGPGTRRSEYFNIVKKANAQGWIRDLVEAAFQEIPGNALLRAAAADLASDAEQPVVALSPSARADAADAGAYGALQRLVTRGDLSVNADQLLKRMGHVGCLTGAVEAGGMHQGTCLLVGPDVVLTNHHVIKPLLGLDVAELAVRFDRYVDENDVVQTGWTVPLHAAWHLHSRPHGAADESSDPNDTPAPAELDYALVRLADRAADRPCPGGGGARGFQSLTDTAANPPVGNHVTLVQHPAGAPRQMSFGHVLSYGGADLRVRYTANTKGGSSGSPVINFKGQLVALHHAGDPNFARMAQYNQGIPINLIVDDITAAGLMDRLSA